MNPQGFRWIRLPLRLALYARDDWTCLACGLRGRWTKQPSPRYRARALSLDHVQADGGNRADNLVTLCVSCNATRADVPFDVWRPDLLDALAFRLTSPVDRALGLALCRELDPGWLRSQRWRPRTAA